MSPCLDKNQFLSNLRQVNEQAGVDSQLVDIIVAFAKLKIDRSEVVDFYPSSLPQNDPLIDEFLAKNRHLNRRAGRFLAAYFHEMHQRKLCAVLNPAHLSRILNTDHDLLIRLAHDSEKHYETYYIPKRNGRKRKIDSPRKPLKRVQRKILDRVLQQVPINSHAEGFVRRKSILTNAGRHVGRKIVIKMDIRHFFPSISFSRVTGVFEALGYPYNVADLLAKLTCHEGYLPIGAPTSPAISNIICRKMDKRFSRLGQKSGFNYSRYADDIAISSNHPNLNGMIPFFYQIIAEEGFEVNQDKTVVMRSGARQKITGVVVNEKTNAPREEIRKLRAVLCNCLRNGPYPEMRKWAQKEKNYPGQKYSLSEFRASLLGRINYVRLVNNHKGNRLLKQFKQIEFYPAADCPV